MSEQDWLTPPPGFVKGCLPRVSKPGAMAPLFAEHIKVIPPQEWDGILRARVDRGEQLSGRADVEKIKTQDGIGSCAREATDQAIEVIARRAGYDFVEFNPWPMYLLASGGRDRGSSIDENLRLARDVGAVPCSFFPRYDERGRIVNPWNKEPPDGWREVAAQYRIDEWYDATSIAEVGTGLLLDFVAVIGWSSHAECMVNLFGGQKADVANSWDVDWGDQGFHVEPLSRINWNYGAFLIRTVVDRGDP